MELKATFRKAVKLIRRQVQNPAFIAAVLVAGLALPLALDANAQRWLDQGSRSFSYFGDPLIGIDLTLPRANIATFLRDTVRSLTIVDHGVTRRSYVAGVIGYLARGSVTTVGDALAWFGVPLTERQSQSLRPCRRLDDITETIVVQADPYEYGIASWYGPGFHGRLAASGEIYNMYDPTAAHKSLPLGSMVRVVSQRTGESAVVRINDRGPYIGGRIIDLSQRSKQMLGMDGGLAAVYLERLSTTRTGAPCLLP